MGPPGRPEGQDKRGQEGRGGVKVGAEREGCC